MPRRRQQQRFCFLKQDGTSSPQACFQVLLQPSSIFRSSRSLTLCLHLSETSRQADTACHGQAVHGPEALALPVCASTFSQGRSSPRSRLSRPFSLCSGYTCAGNVAFLATCSLSATLGREATAISSGGHCKRNVPCPGTRCFIRRNEL